MIDLRSCGRHRTVLLDFVASGTTGPTTAAALDHLDRCDRCLGELEATSLAVVALRRIGSEAEHAEPPPDAWPRLRERVVRWRAPRFTFMSPIAGMAMSIAVVAASVLGTAGLPGSASEAGSLSVQGPAESLSPVEEAWLRSRVDPARRPAPARSPETQAPTPAVATPSDARRGAGGNATPGPGGPHPFEPESYADRRMEEAYLWSTSQVAIAATVNEADDERVRPGRAEDTSDISRAPARS